MTRKLVVAVLSVSLTIMWAAPASPKGGVYPQTKHGNSSTGVNRTPDWPTGVCEQCHVQHGGGSPNAFGLFVPNTNALCATGGCHGIPGPNGIFQGLTTYNASRHATSSVVVWPGPDMTVDPGAPPAKLTGDAGKCVNCHTPHGYKDGAGLIPTLIFSREEKLCIVCHDGSPASKDVKADLAKVYRHTAGAVAGVHDVAEAGNPAKYGASPTNNRHAECADCHNSHVAKADPVTPVPPAASNRLLGMGRVAVINGAAGLPPTFTYRGPANLSPVLEYEICFKCHSSWTTLPFTTPSGGTPKDMAVQFNPNNASYHPVEVVGKNPNINPNAFVAPWTASKLLYCTDCHASDATGPGAARGPHGSVYNYILKKDYRASSSQRTTTSTELCFDCHQYGTYADGRSSNQVLGYSRFNPPQYSRGHTFHVDQRQQPCYACHESHGSPTRPHILAAAAPGRTTYLTSFTETVTSGTCTPNCHASGGSRTYTTNYPR